MNTPECWDVSASEKQNNHMLMFEHYEYDEGTQTRREGTHEDSAELTKIFRYLKFTVHKIYTDFTHQEIKNKIERFTEKDFGERGSVIIIVATHGHENGVLAAKDTLYQAHDIWEPIINCDKLQNFMKIFIFQACRGLLKENKVQVDAISPPELLRLPDATRKDVLLAFSTVEGNVSNRYTTGSPYLQTLSEELYEWPGGKIDLVSILTRVTQRVVDEVVDGQTPVYLSYLGKSIMYKENLPPEVRKKSLGGSQDPGPQYDTSLQGSNVALIYHDAHHERKASQLQGDLNNINITASVQCFTTAEKIKKDVYRQEAKSSSLLVVSLCTWTDGVVENIKKYLMPFLVASKCKNFASVPKGFLWMNVVNAQQDGQPNMTFASAQYVTDHADIINFHGKGLASFDRLHKELQNCASCPKSIDRILTSFKSSTLYPCHFESTLRMQWVFGQKTAPLVTKRNEFLCNDEKWIPEVYGKMRPRIQKDEFHGRENELQNIRDTLIREKTSSGITIVISGAGGIGKTELALEVTEKNKHVFKRIIWLNAETEQNLVEDMSRIYEQLNPSTSRKKFEKDTEMLVKNFYESIHRQKTLIVFDNATCDESDDFLTKFLPPTITEESNVYIIVTSQYTEWITQEKVPIEEYDVKDAVAFIQKKLCAAKIEEDHIMIEKLVEWTGCLTISLELATAYIIQKRKCNGDYCIAKLLEDAKPIQLEGRHTRNVKHEKARNISQVWDHSLKSVANEETCGTLAKEILNIMAYMQPDVIPISFFNITGKKQEFIQEACVLLAEYSLVKYDANGQLCSIHRLLQEVLREKHDIRKILIYLKADILNIDDNPRFQMHKDMYYYFGHIYKIWSHALDDESLVNEFFLISAALPNTLYSVGRYIDALELYEVVVEKQRRVLGEDHVVTLRSMYDKAFTLHSLGRYTEARELYEVVVEKQRRVLGEDHVDTLRSMYNKANTLYSVGRYIDALELYEVVVEKQRRVLGEDHDVTLRSMYEKAFTLHSLGRYTEALELYEVVVEKQRRVLGEDQD